MKTKQEWKLRIIKPPRSEGKQKITWKPLTFLERDNPQPDDRATKEDDNMEKDSEPRQDDMAEQQRKRLERAKEQVIQAAIGRINKHAKWGGSVTIYQFLRDTLLQWHSNVFLYYIGHLYYILYISHTVICITFAICITFCV